MNKPSPVRALSLLSGGLDSRLATCVLRDQGIEVHGVVFESPFFSSAAARRASEQLGLPLHVIPFTEDIIGLVEHPPHGFGGEMNPCIDCHARMLRRAGALMEELGFHFLSTGEVLNQRPMSQNMASLALVARESGYADLIVRPMSARLLPETRPEREGWVDRSRLLDLQGRSRKPQMKMAERYGISDYPTPAGGCLLTEPNFAARLRDLKKHEGIRDLKAIELLRVGRHFRLGPRTKVIVGRNQQDNDWLESHAGDDAVLAVDDVPGPTVLIHGEVPEGTLQAAASICARYAPRVANAPSATVTVRDPRGTSKLNVRPADPSDVRSILVGQPAD
jgi:tRNA U34 2-thiouridine synthase MnmA/TrmU